ncbi:hypothetical protein GC093_20040 [Paenibacillus sp. LMG 31456]|uniref:SLH domain-containing protein n=1 Tax=Paenibacillus foliorum TaxID=2654974 RepID=A0A972K242_9BACL|nr:S-layer homology domain-containing protein [Paenibacillus foliorum]NOU95500.1 hypothetical protein [Paenibacillus foliorum]
MRKSFLIVFLSLTLAFVTGNGVTQAAESKPKPKTSADFKDLKDLDASLKVKIDKWLAKGYFEGISEDEFGVNETISRAEFAKIIAFTVGLKIDPTLKTSSFSDVSVNDSVYGYALPYIEAIRRVDITDGIGNNLFDPSGRVTREQLAIFAIRSLNKDADARETKIEREDGTVSQYAKHHVALSKHLFAFLRSEEPFFGTLPANRRMLLLSLDEITVTYCGCGPSIKQMEKTS